MQYLLMGGTVAVQRVETRETAVMSPTNFFGYESLQPNAGNDSLLIVRNDTYRHRHLCILDDSLFSITFYFFLMHS